MPILAEGARELEVTLWSSVSRSREQTNNEWRERRVEVRAGQSSGVLIVPEGSNDLERTQQGSQLLNHKDGCDRTNLILLHLSLPIELLKLLYTISQLVLGIR